MRLKIMGWASAWVQECLSEHHEVAHQRSVPRGHHCFYRACDHPSDHDAGSRLGKLASQLCSCKCVSWTTFNTGDRSRRWFSITVSTTAASPYLRSWSWALECCCRGDRKPHLHDLLFQGKNSPRQQQSDLHLTVVSTSCARTFNWRT